MSLIQKHLPDLESTAASQVWLPAGTSTLTTLKLGTAGGPVMSPDNTVPATYVRLGSIVGRSVAALVAVAYELWSVYAVFAAVNALRRLDCAARSCARERAPRNCGMAIAIKMAMISTTTINSMRVKPSSASFRRATSERIDCTGLAPFHGFFSGDHVNRYADQLYRR